MSKYLFIGAHPDDIEISAMGFLLKLLDTGHEVHMMVMSCSDDRYKEQDEVINYLTQISDQFSTIIYHHTDGELEQVYSDMRHAVERYIGINEIDVVVTHFLHDTHPDHRAVSRAVTDASRKVSLIYFESPNVYDFEPNFYVSLTKYILDLKLMLMSMHVSQNRRNNGFYMDKIRGASTFRGQAVYEEYAEAFNVHRMKAML